MIVRYGKDFDMRRINRDLSAISGWIKESEALASEFWSSVSQEVPRCRVCSSADRKLFMRFFDRYDYFECKGCGMLYLGQVPQCKTIYEADENNANGDCYMDESIFEERVNMIARPKVDFVLDVCNSFENGHSMEWVGCRASNLNHSWKHEGRSGPTSWLDVGCGGGDILYYLSYYKGITCEGIEADKREVQLCQKRGLQVVKDFIDTRNPSQEVCRLLARNDIVSLFNVLEHVDEPSQMVEYLYASMKKGSVLVLEVPRHPSAASFANLTSGGKTYRHLVPPAHISVFSEKSMETLLCGKFKIIGKWGFGQGFADMVNNAMFLSGKEENDLYLKVLECSNQMQRVFDEAGLSDSMIFVAVREE